MKKILFILLAVFLTHTGFSQTTADHTAPAMTTEFVDSLKQEITKIIPTNYTIKIFYQSTMSAQGKLLKPLITYEAAALTMEDNEFVQKLKLLLINAPAWKPAIDNTSNQPIDTTVTFSVIIKNGKINISEKLK